MYDEKAVQWKTYWRTPPKEKNKDDIEVAKGQVALGRLSMESAIASGLIPQEPEKGIPLVGGNDLDAESDNEGSWESNTETFQSNTYTVDKRGDANPLVGTRRRLLT